MLSLHLFKTRKTKTEAPPADKPGASAAAAPPTEKPRRDVASLRHAAGRTRWRHLLSRPKTVVVALGLMLVAGGLWLSSFEPEAQGYQASPSPPPPSRAARLVGNEDAAPPRQPLLPVTVRRAIASEGTIAVSASRTDAFVWPAAGNITSYMGPVHPLGIDIGLNNGEVSPIRATAAGVVTFAGGNAYDGYGYYVELDHGAGLSSLYGHFSVILVRQGQFVAQGEVIGHGGSTGKSDGKHLHFELLNHGERVDPLQVLPASPGMPASVTFDCAHDAIVLEAGSRLRLDLAATLGGSAKLIQAAIEDGSLRAEVGIEDGRIVVVQTLPALSPAQLDERSHRLVMWTNAAGLDNEPDLVCELMVRTITAPPHYFVRQAAPASSGSGSTPAPSVPSSTAVPSSTGSAGTTEPVAIEPASAPPRVTPTSVPPAAATATPVARTRATMPAEPTPVAPVRTR
jgi:murein DD-endopeptidase MepM/ murein hydrolase activator NlpD